MRHGPDGAVQCQNCGSELFTSPTLVDGVVGGMDVFLYCSNCSHPLFIYNESDPEAAAALGAYFAAHDHPDES